MRAKTTRPIYDEESDSNLIRALEILTGSAGDIPMEAETASRSLVGRRAAEGMEGEPAGDIPLAPGTRTPVILRFSQNAELDQELSFLVYRRRVISAWPDSPRRTAGLAGAQRRVCTV